MLLSSPGSLPPSASSRRCARRVNGGTARPRRAASSCHAARASAHGHPCTSAAANAGASNSNTQKALPASVGALGNRGAAGERAVRAGVSGSNGAPRAHQQRRPAGCRTLPGHRGTTTRASHARAVLAARLEGAAGGRRAVDAPTGRAPWEVRTNPKTLGRPDRAARRAAAAGQMRPLVARSAAPAARARARAPARRATPHAAASPARRQRPPSLRATPGGRASMPGSALCGAALPAGVGEARVRTQLVRARPFARQHASEPEQCGPA